MQEIVDLVTTSSLELVLVAYLIYRDQKFNSKLDRYMEKTSTLIDKVFEFLEEIRNGKKDT